MEDNSEPKAIITTIRHGEKDVSGKLTTDGVLQAERKGSKSKYLKGDVILLHSGVERVKDTLVSFAQHMNYDNYSTLESANKLINYQGYVSQYLQYVYDSKEKGILFSKWDEVSGKEAEFDRIVSFLSQENTSSEPEIYPSPKHMAIRLARIIATEIDFATITIPDVRTNFVNGTHEPVLMSFLYYFLQDYSPKDANNFVKSIGGTVDYTEGFDIYIYEDLKSSNKVLFKFKEIEKEVDQIKLKAFCLSENIR